jgi:hypothetical protein
MNLFCNLSGAWPALAPNPEVMAMSLYVLLRLFRLPTDESASALFRQKAV